MVEVVDLLQKQALAFDGSVFNAPVVAPSTSLTAVRGEVLCLCLGFGKDVGVP